MANLREVDKDLYAVPRLQIKTCRYFLIAGGPQSKNTKAILAEVLKSSQKKTPNIAYIGTASNDNKEFFLMLSQI